MNHITAYDNSVGYNSVHSHRVETGFEIQYTAYNKGFGVQGEVLTVRRYEGKVGTYVMVWANIALNIEGTTGSAYCSMYSSPKAIQVALENAGFQFGRDFVPKYGGITDEKALVAEAAAAMGYPDCHIFVGHS